MAIKEWVSTEILPITPVASGLMLNDAQTKLLTQFNCYADSHGGAENSMEESGLVEEVYTDIPDMIDRFFYLLEFAVCLHSRLPQCSSAEELEHAHEKIQEIYHMISMFYNSILIEKMIEVRAGPRSAS